jgi:hypothetical protein
MSRLGRINARSLCWSSDNSSPEEALRELRLLACGAARSWPEFFDLEFEIAKLVPENSGVDLQSERDIQPIRLVFACGRVAALCELSTKALPVAVRRIGRVHSDWRPSKPTLEVHSGRSERTLTTGLTFSSSFLLPTEVLQVLADLELDGQTPPRRRRATPSARSSCHAARRIGRTRPRAALKSGRALRC